MGGVALRRVGDGSATGSAAAPSRRRSVLLTAALCGVSVTLSLLAGEYVLRGYERWLSQKKPQLPTVLNVYMANPAGTGSLRMRPNLDLIAHVGHHAVSVKTNSHGMRWREVTVEKPAGKQRIAFLGDSFTFGLWADSVEKSLVGVFEKSMSSRYEVLNFGVPGYGSEDAELLLKEQVIRFDPDYVILMFFNGNDFRDTYLGLNRSRIVDGAAILDGPNFTSKVPPEFQKSDFVVSRPARVRSPMLRALREYALFRFAAPFLGLDNLSLRFEPSTRFTSSTFWSRVPYPEVALRARDAALAAIGRMHVFARERGLHFGIVTIPYREQVYAEREAGHDYDTALPQRFVQQLAQERSLPYLDLLPTLRADVAAHNRELFAEPDLHFNNRGHAVAGRAVADWFQCCLAESDVKAAVAAPKQ